MSESDNDVKVSPFVKYKRVLIAVGVISAGGLISVVQSLNTPAPSDSTNKSDTANSPAGKAGLGAINPTAEFNKTFADQLRIDLTTKLEAERTAMRAQMEVESQQQAMQLQSSLAAQKQEILDAIAASKKAEPETEIAVKKQIRPPSQAAKSPSDVTPSGSPQSAISAPSFVDRANTLVPIVAPTGFIRATMINGVVAQPDLPRTFLGRLEGDYIAANGFRISLDGCMVTIEGIADVSASRIDGKPAVLTCNFDSGYSKSWDVAGYIVDEDGIRGIRGVTVNNLENKLISGSLTGGLAGLGEAIRQKQTTQTASGTGGVATNITGSVGGVVAGAALARAGSNATAALADYYAQYKTTVQTGAGTKFSITLLSELTVPKEGSYITPLATRK